jgi:iron complex outermembrane recepter protein
VNLPTGRSVSGIAGFISFVARSGPLSATCIGALCVCAGGWIPTTAHAQIASQAQTAQEGFEANSIEEIIITARKRTESVQDTPESVDVLSSQTLADAHVTRMDDIGTFVSNVNIATQSDNSPGVVMRGVGSFGVVQGVGFYANDVQLYDGQTVRPDDLERIEVLKGPQGTLYGGNNIGGAIKYITKLPTDTFEGSTAFEAGNYGTQTYSAIVSGPLYAASPDLLDGRLSVYDTRSDGFLYDPVLHKTVDGGSESGGRATLLYKGLEATTVTVYLNGDWNRSAAGGNLNYKAVADDVYSLQLTDVTPPEYSRVLYSGTLKVEHQFADDLQLTSLSTYFHSRIESVTDTSKGPIPFLTGYDHFLTQVYSQELRLANSGSGPFKWLAGLFAQANNDDAPLTSRSLTSGPPPPYAFSYQTTDPRQYHNEYAAFGNATYDLSAWTFEAGLRADYYSNSMDDGYISKYDGLNGVSYNPSAAQDGREIMPKASVSYHFDKDVMGYSTISRGFEAGDEEEVFDANGNPEILSYRPETIWNYEIGLKTTLFDRLRLNAAMFYINYDNRLAQINTIESGTFVGLTRNIGASHNYGGEVDFAAQLAERLVFSGNFGITKAIWGNVPYLNPNLCPQGPPCASNPEMNLRGLTASFVPSYTGSLSLDWTHNIAANWIFGARVDAQFLGYSFWDVTDNARQDPYQLLNVSARLEHGGWTVSAHASNLTSRLYNTGYSTGPDLGAPFNVGHIGEPRIWSAGAAYHW